MRRALTRAAVVVAVVLCCVAPLDVRALPPADPETPETAEVAPTPEIGEDVDKGALEQLAALEGKIIAETVQNNYWSWVPGVISAIVTSLLGLVTTVILRSNSADRKRTDETIAADRAQVQRMTTELIASLREQAQIYKDADQANREGLAAVVKSVGRVDDDVRALRRDLGHLDERVTVLESGASTTRGRRTKDTP